MKFLHTADWQLGMRRHFLDADAQPRYSDARISAIESVGRVVDAEGCDFVVVCGDVFETNHVPETVVARALENMRRISVPVYLLPGNHDPLDARSIYTSERFLSRIPQNVQVLTSAGPHRVGDGVELLAAPWFSKSPDADLVARALAAGDAATRRPPVQRIVVGHGAVSSLEPDRNNPSTIDQQGLEAALAKGSISYVALGDRHSTTSVGTSGRIWYSGTQEVTSFDEDDPGNVLTVELQPGTCHVQRHRVGRWRFWDLCAAVNSRADVESLLAQLERAEHHDRTVVRLALVGSLSVAENAALEAGLERLEHSYAAIRQWSRHWDVAVYLDDDELGGLGLSGYAADVVTRLGQLSRATPGDSRKQPVSERDQVQAARDALGLLYRLAGARR